MKTELPNHMVNGTMYHPKGSMCMVCKHKERDCWYLPFSTMPTIEIYAKGDLEIHKVKCIEFDRAE